jgi:hypothetical protein
MVDLKVLADGRWQVTLDESATLDTDRETKLWCYRIPGQRVGKQSSFVSVHGPETLAVWSDRRNVVHALEALAKAEGWRIHQRGDHEIRILFPPDRLPEIASIIRARKVPRMTEEQKAAAKERLAPWAFEKGRTASA